MQPIVEVASGKVRGRTTNGVSAFLGIPYAAPPVGAARFRAPTPAATWDGIRDATEHGPTCTQSPYPPPLEALLPKKQIPGPDYLNVNVWAPETGASGLPVMVWIHGGAFTRGSNSISNYDGSAFARDGVVLVSINYRLGVSGFVSLDGAPDNRGLLDQLFALAWVQENIEAFGGDPANVTVFGESAGGISIAMLLGAPAAQGLFAKAIIQSGSGGVVADRADAQRFAAELAAHLGISPTADAFSRVAPDALTAAQDALTAAFVLDPNPERWGDTLVRNGLGVTPIFPVLDGVVIPRLPAETIQSGAGANVPLLAGTTTDEFRLFLIPTGIAVAITPEALPFMLKRFGIDPAVAETYSASRPEATSGDILCSILSDHAFRGPTMDLALTHSAAGNSVYAYEFAWRTAVQDLRACHALEIPFVFDTLGTEFAAAGATPPQRVADDMHSAWVAFARTGDPGWAAFTQGRRSVLTFDESGGELVDGPRASELAVLQASAATVT
ncbi:carboxylesterase/lipase family protein [Antrihabitans sp. YC2-6]|uniref:carboxylesterase/lipase family protein n=1 Tax=Antrihabitans sp. YC2-6 TaxID=2799498 RepID=UPI0018F31207|nr:carboxylesterase/lipase family protein [Antrihabitans sp. YC2-6]MBJ8344635.1 carboxylesterase/lipase family protein [Antrihabitans sp. YC2-6]